MIYQIAEVNNGLWTLIHRKTPKWTSITNLNEPIQVVIYHKDNVCEIMDSAYKVSIEETETFVIVIGVRPFNSQKYKLDICGHMDGDKSRADRVEIRYRD